MTKQLYSLPSLETSRPARQNLSLALTKYSTKKRLQRLPVSGGEEEEGEGDSILGAGHHGDVSGRTMRVGDRGVGAGDDEEVDMLGDMVGARGGGGGGGGDTYRAQRQDSRLAEPGDTGLTPRLYKEDRSRSEPSLLPPIDASGILKNIDNVAAAAGGDGGETPGTGQVGSKGIKLPVASRYQLYSIGLTYNNTTGGKERTPRESSRHHRAGGKTKPQTYKEINSKRVKHRSNITKTQPSPLKFEADDNSLSIRKKIEQYRHWHEEQYRQKLMDIKQEAERERHAEANKVASHVHKGKIAPPPAHPTTQHSQPPKPTAAAVRFSHRSNSYDNILPQIPLKMDHNFNSQVLKEEDEEVAADEEMDHRQSNTRPHISEHKVDTVITESAQKQKREAAAAAANRTQNGDGTNAAETATDRPVSSKTWHTWRSVNDSYAYTDVKKYIKDNELMDEEREKYIQDWVTEVTRSSFGKGSDDIINGGGGGPGGGTEKVSDHHQ